MQKSKVAVFAAFLVAAVGGSMLVGPAPSLVQVRQERRAERQAERNYWRYHDGRWSHWDAADKTWYYTDGQNWYYHTGKAWAPYRFDRAFGRENFERGTYAVPAPGTNVAVPTHGVFVPTP